MESYTLSFPSYFCFWMVNIILTNMLAVLVALLCSICVDTAHIKKESVNFHVRENFVRKSGKLDKSQLHEVVFAVQQLNLDEIEQIALERSTPGSPMYQKWLSYSEVNSYVSNLEGAGKVKEWLRSNGIQPSWQSKHHHYIKASATLEKWEALFNTEFHAFEDQSSTKNKVYFRTQEYSLPEEIHEHVSAVFNTVQVPPSLHRRIKRKNLKNNSTIAEPYKTNLRYVPPKEVQDTKMKPQTYGINVNFLNYWYGIPSNIGDASLKQAVFETADEYFSPNDLTQYQTMNNIVPQAAQVIGGHSTSSCSTNGRGKDCYEGNLDIQFLMGVAQTTTSIYWYVDSSSSSNDPFVVWMTDIADDDNPSKSNSISWGEDEVFVSKSVLDSFNTEAAKLATMGVSVFVSSGDDGVAGDYCSTCKANRRSTPMNCPCTADSGSTGTQWRGSGTWSGQGYFPSFPATSPYVTAVGATMGPEEDFAPEVICQSQLGGVITSGGGFSTYYATPSWQVDAVNSWKAQYAASGVTPSPGYNPNGRGFPDISVLGVYYETVVQGGVEYLFGTSASTPVVAALISLVNARRLENGLPSVGFINPSLYAASAWSKYTDITSGHIKCCSDSNDPPNPLCCTSGFTATPGWDPVAGFGSVSFSNLLDILGGAGTSPTAAPSTVSPSVTPTVRGTSGQPSVSPSFKATQSPYRMPIPPGPSAVPTSSAPVISVKPTAVPTIKPTRTPTVKSTRGPTVAATVHPSPSPSVVPTTPTRSPTIKRNLPNGGYTSGHV